jgi:hypothetical protein
MRKEINCVTGEVTEHEDAPATLEIPRSYQELRASAYPRAADFADAYYWAQKGNLALMEAYLENCDAVKLLYPK